jgi:hypothetical protein
METIEREDGVYRVKAMAPPAEGGFCAMVVIECQRRGRIAEAYREESIDCARVFDDPGVALSRALDRAWNIIHRDPSRLAC